jgi:hypothetical protein
MIASARCLLLLGAADFRHPHHPRSGGISIGTNAELNEIPRWFQANRGTQAAATGLAVPAFPWCGQPRSEAQFDYLSKVDHINHEAIVAIDLERPDPDRPGRGRPLHPSRSASARGGGDPGPIGARDLERLELEPAARSAACGAGMRRRR